MPVKRRLPKKRNPRITDAAIAAWRARDDEALRKALRLLPWEVSPSEAWGKMPEYMEGKCIADGWREAVEIRRQLQEAVGEEPDGPTPLKAHAAHRTPPRRAPFP